VNCRRDLAAWQFTAPDPSLSLDDSGNGKAAVHIDHPVLHVMPDGKERSDHRDVIRLHKEPISEKILSISPENDFDYFHIL
jgi:hypothetical protein